MANNKRVFSHALRKYAVIGATHAKFGGAATAFFGGVTGSSQNRAKRSMTTTVYSFPAPLPAPVALPDSAI